MCYSRSAGIVGHPELSANRYDRPNGTVGHPLHKRFYANWNLTSTIRLAIISALRNYNNKCKKSIQ
uniref:Uncharacterized protein n=1 Tax=Romanomermis culicivorax TaxID=13658 RepID=A0A915K0A7_ROMCU